MDDRNFIKLTFELAKKGSGFVYPNPMVGAVLVKNNKIIATGFHKFFGAPHAEAEVIRIAGNKAKDAVLYVNLEPCNNWGKCPPCTDLIIKSKINKVVCAMEDPNPKTQGQGFEKLRKNGIEVVCGILEKQATQLNKQYIHHIKNVTTHITIKSAMSLDGKIATKTGDSKWLTSIKSRDFVHRLRTTYDAIIVGTNTVIKDNPELSSHNKGKNPVRVIFDENLSTPKNYNVLNGKIPTVIFYGHRVKNIPKYFIKDCIKLMPINFSLIKKDFNIVIDKLNDMSLKRILAEGGGQLNASLLESGRVNDMFVFVAPMIVGGKDAVTIVEGLGISMIKNALKFKKIQIKKIDKDILIKGIF